jgi:chromosome segregation ATPase
MWMRVLALYSMYIPVWISHFCVHTRMDLSFLFFFVRRNIQVENPVAVLDQEEAKKFLTGKPEDKYNFFMKATELERVDRTYASTVDHVQELRDSQEKIQDNLQQKIEHVEMLKKKWEQHQALEKLENKVAELNVKYAWAFHNAVDDEFQAATEVRAHPGIHCPVFEWIRRSLFLISLY